MTQHSFAELKKIAANQTTTIKQQNEILANQHRDLGMKKAQLEMERERFEESKHADIRHQFNQCYDFAIRSLPWWKRSTKDVIDRATEIMLEIRNEAAKHIAMRQAEYQAEQEAIAEAQRQDEALDAIKRVLDGDGDSEKTHAVKPDRETEEVETL